MKAILFVILNVSVCFPRGSVLVEILIPGEFGGRTKKISRLAIARHDPPCSTRLIFTLDAASLRSYFSKSQDPLIVICNLSFT